MSLAYDPVRVRSLTRSTAMAIDALANIRSWDHAATDAIGVSRAAQRHLEHDWMPLLSDIVTSTAMTEWWRRHHALRHPSFPWIVAHPAWHAMRPNRFESMTDDELLGMVYSDGLTHSAGPGWTPPDFTDPFWSTLPELAAELARRSSSREFAAQLVADIHRLPLVAMSVPLADFDPDLVAELTIGLLSGPSIDSGITHRLHGFALDTTMRHLISTASGSVLDVVTDPAAMLTLASFERLDQSLVHDFVRVGLYDSVAGGTRTVDDGIAAIVTLVGLTNGPLDRGMGVGAARGVADSMFGYVNTIAAGIDALGQTDHVFATDENGMTGPRLGTVADMRDLFGALLRDDQARSTMATVLGAYTDETVQRLGPQITTSSLIDDPVKLGLLLDMALLEERIEVDLAAAADDARRSQLGKTIGFGLGLGLGALGVPSLVGSVAKELVSRSRPGRGSNATIGERRLGPATHEGVLLGVLGDALDNPARRRDYGLAEVGDADWADLRRRLADIDAAAVDVAQQAAVIDLKNHAARHVPAIDSLIVELSTMAGMDHLQIGGFDVDAD